MTHWHFPSSGTEWKTKSQQQQQPKTTEHKNRKNGIKWRMIWHFKYFFFSIYFGSHVDNCLRLATRKKTRTPKIGSNLNWCWLNKHILILILVIYILPFHFSFSSTFNGVLAIRLTISFSPEHYWLQNIIPFHFKYQINLIRFLKNRIRRSKFQNSLHKMQKKYTTREIII